MKQIIIEFNWLTTILDSHKENVEKVTIPNSPDLISSDSAYGRFVREHKLNKEERLLLALSLVQHFDGTTLNALLNKNNSFRLVQCSKTGLLLPTGETFLRLMAGKDLEKRLSLLPYFDTSHLFYKKSIIDFGAVSEGVARYYGIIKLTPTYNDLFIHNKHNRPRFSNDFPAHLLHTDLEWHDLILNQVTATRLEEIKTFLKHHKTLRESWGLSKHLKPGYRCLFHGPSGTGKTLAATLLGKHIGRDVYKVDLSTVISKYVGETSKNLNALFNTAEDKDWILFFDEGDALFGKRIDTSQADDKNVHFANQDIAFLLQRIENYNGLIIVASNLRKNMDEAFNRRFQNIVYFNIPDEDNRLRLWQENFPKKCTLGTGIDCERLAKQHLLSAASILNIINRVSLLTIQNNSTEISFADLDLCIKDEMHK